MNWEKRGNVQILLTNLNSNKIAGFDLDHTLIKPKSGKTHPKDKDDMELCFPNIKEKLTELHKNDFSLVIFSNQSSFDKPDKKEIIISRIEKFLEIIDLPVTVMISTEGDYCRKPNTGMWDFFNGINIEESFYVGDAAGRTRNPLTKKKDFSCSDRMFALNVGCKFYTPEKFFQPESFSSVEIHVLNKTFKTFPSSQPELDLENFDVVMLIGPPGSGKSYLASMVNGYTTVSQDELKYKSKCLKLMDNTIKEGGKVIVDNTHGKISTRKQYLEIAKKYKKNVLGIEFNITKEQCLFLVNYRCKVNKKIKLPDVAIHAYYKNYESPTKEEGFEKIKTRSFVPNQNMKIFNQYF